MAWIHVDDAGRVLATNPHNMAGNTGWNPFDGSAPGILYDDKGVPLYKLDGGKLIARTEEERTADYVQQAEARSDAERLADLEEAFSLMLSGVTE